MVVEAETRRRPGIEDPRVHGKVVGGKPTEL
jgi:hypothetical protein